MEFWGRVWDELTVLIVAAMPVLELRGAVPLAFHLGLTWQEAFLFAYIGNFIPVVPLILLSRKALTFLSATKWFVHPSSWLERHIRGKQDVVVRYSAVGLAILVAVPLPGTGAWTGAILASLLNLRLKYAVPAIAFGIFVADIIVTAITYGLLT